ncbi:MAG: hypothetical protein LBS74_10445 [Oscillospiraceae bacterium]|jgi:hypothetical protein|nr:hypothetical protein [Oscillospiraceae bacterium]
MKKIIKKKAYDTEKATIVGRKTFGAWGDVDGYEEILYKTLKGDYFVYGIGGEESAYPQEAIVPITEDEAKEF